jgi:hypothetical protein
MCGDSAVCYSHDGEIYRVSSDAQKIIQVGNKVLFLSGLAKVGELVEKQFKLSNRSVESLRDILANTHKTYKPFCNVEEKYYNNGAVLGVWENGKPCVYTVDSTKNFVIEKNVSEDDTFYMIVDGIKQEVVKNVAEKQFMLMQRGIFNGIPNFYKRVYDRVASEEIGGKLTVYAIQNGQPFITLVHNIKEPAKLKRLTDIAIDLGEGKYKFIDSFHHIKDLQGRVRAQLGKLENGDYGMMLKDSQGDKVVIDQNGILQTYSFVAQDNLDGSNSLIIPFFIDEGTHEVRECKINLILDHFRAYSKAAASGGTLTSESGGSDVVTSEVNASTTVSQMDQAYTGEVHYTGVDGDMNHHNHPHAHKHFLEGHDHQVHINNHKHNIAAHSHDLVFGIYKGTNASNVGVSVNSHLVTNAINTNTEVDIAQYVQVGWNRLEISSSSLGRVVASVFLKLFVTT